MSPLFGKPYPVRQENPGIADGLSFTFLLFPKAQIIHIKRPLHTLKADSFLIALQLAEIDPLRAVALFLTH